MIREVGWRTTRDLINRGPATWLFIQARNRRLKRLEVKHD